MRNCNNNIINPTTAHPAGYAWVGVWLAAPPEAGRSGSVATYGNRTFDLVDRVTAADAVEHL
jgi:hypothetical protein